MKLQLSKLNIVINWVVLSGLMLIGGCSGRENINKTSLVGNPLPAFNFYLPTKLSYFSTTNIRPNRSTVFFYFSPTCPYCRAMLTEIIESKRKFSNTDFYLVTPVDFKHVEDLYKKMNLAKYDNIILAIDRNRAFMNYFGIKGVPYIVVYDKNKRLNDIFPGFVSIKQLKKSTT